MKLKIYFILIIKVCFCFDGAAQGLHQTYAYANELLRLEQFEPALHTYHRVLFFGEGAYQETIYQQMGNCYFELGEYDQAARYFDLAYFKEDNDSIRTELTFKKTFSLLLDKNFTYAQMELFNLPDSLSTYFAQKRDFYSGITYFGLEEFSDSEQFFLGAIPEREKDARYRLEAIFDQLEKVEKINPNKARILSMFIPGLGQIYAGDWGAGINSFILNGGLIALGVHTAVQFTLFDAAITILPWYQRFYMGGYMGAEKAAFDKIASKRGEIYRDVLEVIEETKKKEQPALGNLSKSLN
ncbi:MAG: hypothetical protein WD398_10400 [Cyclobacteriaceae bacterium]